MILQQPILSQSCKDEAKDGSSPDNEDDAEDPDISGKMNLF